MISSKVMGEHPSGEFRSSQKLNGNLLLLFLHKIKPSGGAIDTGGERHSQRWMPLYDDVIQRTMDAFMAF